MGFKPLTINTSPENEAHILAEDDAALYAGMLAQDSVLNLGNKLKATVVSNNKVRISDGIVLVGGHAGRIIKGDYEDMTINNGVSGQKRNDIIAARFIAGVSGGADSYKLVVIQGTPGTTAKDPTFAKGDLYNGDKQRDYPLWRVKIENLSIVKVEQMFTVGKSTEETVTELLKINEKLKNQIDALSARVQNHVQRTGATAYSGDYKSQWTLTTQYKDIGNSVSWDDTYYQISPGNTAITVKEGGLYLITASIVVRASNYDNIWMKILRNGAEEHTMITVANGYTTVQCFTTATLSENSKVSVQIAKSTENIDVTCDGGGYLQLIKLT
ncbi:hypothetical protein ACQRDF_11795 [Lachnospiraceae bacterium SGI.054]